MTVYGVLLALLPERDRRLVSPSCRVFAPATTPAAGRRFARRVHGSWPSALALVLSWPLWRDRAGYRVSMFLGDR